MHQGEAGLTTVGTAPGLWTLRALTTWNTSTTPSVLQRSMVVIIAQYIPDRVAVSLRKWAGGALTDHVIIIINTQTCSGLLLTCFQFSFELLQPPQ